MDEQAAHAQPHSEQTQEPEQPSKMKRFIKEGLRVLRITKKPDQGEYKSLLKVTSLGTAIIGAMGFVIFLIKQLLF